MRRRQQSVEQIVAALKQAELGMPVTDLIRQGDIRADVLSLEEAVRGPGIKPGPQTEAAPG